MKILDCTIRDGGYYTNWDFSDSLIKEYAQAMESLPVDYVEVGYRSIVLDGYLGKYFYCPDYVLKNLKLLMPTKKLVVIFNEKDIRVEHVNDLLSTCLDYISMVRIAIDPKNITRALKLAKAVKKLGLEVAFNVMYMSNWMKDPSFLDEIEGIEDYVDYFYMVDSFGGILPSDVKEIIDLVKSKVSVPIGFHGHDNLEMGLINTITALDEGCSIVDATITGMGRGAGNLKMELLLTYLESKEKVSFEYNSLSSVVSEFENLRKDYSWGTSLPYMFSGAKSLPQKQVMEWVGLNRYPMKDIINALNNQTQEVEDNLKLNVLQQEELYSKAIILGGGTSVELHREAIFKYLEKNKDNTCLIHAGTRNVNKFIDIEENQYFGLVGIESEKLSREIGSLNKITQTCVFPPFPRKMGTIIPEEIKEVSKELESINFTDLDTESPMAIAIQVALDLGVKEIYFVGFDGYDLSINQNQFVMANENQAIIRDVMNFEGVDVVFLTPTKYKDVNVSSIYNKL
ncbi:aldolase catalytic domain-containing protein [Wenyingzhuangia sp. IMCC45574]